MVELSTENKFKRNVAHKIRIGDILMGKPILDGDRFSFLEWGHKKIVRVNIIGNIIEKYESEGEKRFGSITIDDGTGQIKAKVFGDDLEKISNLNEGQTILIIGTLRIFNEELYISPEIIKETDSRYLLIRKLESEKEKGKGPEKPAREEMVAVKDKILGTIKSAEEHGGIEMDKLVMTLKDISPVIITQEVQKFLEEGIIFEPRPGKVRYLG